MDRKMTRRIALGTIIGGLMAGPFVIRALRSPRPLEFSENQELREFREKYQTALDFPRTFDPFSGNNIIPGREREGFLNDMLPLFRSQPKETQEKALKIQRRYWSNYAKLDEVEFDYTGYTYHKDGSKKTDDNFAMSAHVWLKYGYGMEIKGKDVNDKPIHWVFNMDGDITLPTVQEMNLSSMFRTFFDLNSAVPEWVVFMGKITEGVELPPNPFIVGQGLYDQVDMIRRPSFPDKLKEYHYNRTYFNCRTGMPELRVQSALDTEEHELFLEGKIDKPKQNFWYNTVRYSQVRGIAMPIELTHCYGENEGGMPFSKEIFAGINIRLLNT